MKHPSLPRVLLVALTVVGALLTVQAEPKKTSKLDGIEIRRSVRYAERRTELKEDAKDDRLLDIVYPKVPMPEAGYPCVVWIHGGGFVSGSRSMGPLVRSLVKRGIAVVALEYYLYRRHHLDGNPNAEKPKPLIHPSRPYPTSLRLGVNAAAEDTELALQWLAENAREYKIDPKRVLIGGSSAGAITSLEVACIRRKVTGVTIRGVLDFCGSVEKADVIEAPVPPLLIVHGEKDMTVGTDYGRELQRQMDKIKAKCVPLFIPDASHSVARPALQSHLKDILDFVDDALK